MSDFEELNKQLEELLPMNEQSMAFYFKDRHVEVCAWVENPTPRDNRYFKYYDSQFISSAKNVARIRIDKAEYVGGNHSERNLKKWELSKKEKQYLIDILNSPSNDYNGLTKWQDILITYNRDNFHIKAEDTIQGNFNKCTRSPMLPKHVQPFSIDYPMPNYLDL